MENRIKKVNFRIISLFILLFGGYIKLFLPVLSLIVIVLQAACLFLGLLYFLKNCNISYWASGYLYFLIIFLIFSFFSSYEYSRTVLFMIIRLTIYLLGIYGLLTVINAKNETELFIEVAIKLGTVIVIIGILSQFGAFINSIIGGTRIETDAQNPIWLSRFCVDMILMIFFFYKGKLRSIDIMKISVFFVFAFFTGSKGPMLSLVLVGGLVWILKYRPKYKGKKVVLVAAVFVLGGTLLAVLQNSASSFISSRYSLDAVMINSYGYRVHRYLFSLNHIMKRPLFGYGAGSWGELYGSKINDYPHNIVLQIAFEYGLVLAIIFVASFLSIVIKQLRIINKLSRQKLVFLVLVLANFCYSMTSGAIFDGNAFLYYYLMCLICLDNKKNLK